MINALFLVAWVVIICVALLTGLMIVKGIRIWLESRAFDKQARSIAEQVRHIEQSAQQIMQQSNRRIR